MREVSYICKDLNSVYKIYILIGRERQQKKTKFSENTHLHFLLLTQIAFSPFGTNPTCAKLSEIICSSSLSLLNCGGSLLLDGEPAPYTSS